MSPGWQVIGSWATLDKRCLLAVHRKMSRQRSRGNCIDCRGKGTQHGKQKRRKDPV